jgi:hypothetical protein
MINIQKLFTAGKKLFIAAAAVIVMTQCTDEGELLTPQAQPAVEQATVAAAADQPTEASFTISGLYTNIVESTDCATCTYVVPAETTLIDGKVLGFKPGAVICLSKGVDYKMLEFVNLEGTEEAPIVIGYCGE